jgi:hypothetical protein
MLFREDFNIGSAQPMSAEHKNRLAFKFLVEVFLSGSDELGDKFVKDDGGRRFVTVEAMERFQRVESSVRSLLISAGRPMPIARIVEEVASYGAEATAEDLERFAEVSEIMAVDWTNSIGLRRWPFFERQDRAAIVQRALVELAEPTHFTRVAQKVNSLIPDRRPMNSHAVAAVMLRYPDIFVSLGRGMYALKNWGITRPPFLKDFLAEAIKSQGGTATAEELVVLGAQRYGFKRTSVLMTLSMNPRLFRDRGSGTYSLI